MPDAKISTLMLRSELENIQAVLKDAAAWEAPDFFALAFLFDSVKRKIHLLIWKMDSAISSFRII